MIYRLCIWPHVNCIVKRKNLEEEAQIRFKGGRNLMWIPHIELTVNLANPGLILANKATFEESNRFLQQFRADINKVIHTQTYAGRKDLLPLYFDKFRADIFQCMMYQNKSGVKMNKIQLMVSEALFVFDCDAQVARCFLAVLPSLLRHNMRRVYLTTVQDTQNWKLREGKWWYTLFQLQRVSMKLDEVSINCSYSLRVR